MRKGGHKIIFNNHRWLIIVVLLILALPPLPTFAKSLIPRRIGLTCSGNYFVLDGEFFDIKDAPGIGLSFRYELDYNIYFENSLGFFKSSEDTSTTSISGFYFGPTLTAILPYFIPYRPIVRAGVGFISVNPITVTPTSTFRPTQTAFYIRAGAGMSRSLRENIQFELMADIWFTPYAYRIYRFNRRYVTAEDKYFSHFVISLGINYFF